MRGEWPAFPTDSEGPAGPPTFHYEGMSMRDYFAGQALAGIVASGESGPSERLWGGSTEAAEHAYELADAMLAAREADDGR